MQQRLDTRIFNMAANLFGSGQAVQPPPVLPDLPEGTLQAVYPAIMQEAFTATMSNYRKHVALYNFQTNAENQEIKQWNNSLKEYLKETQLTQLQSEMKRLFERNENYSLLNSREYNEQVIKFCLEYGPILKKKKIQTVKYATELVFQNILHLYNTQLRRRNEHYIKHRVTTSRPLQEVKLNAVFLTQLKRDDVQSLPICRRSVLNHRKRLQECGIIQDYIFMGSCRAVEFHINPKILVVLDLKTSKIVSAENQPLKPHSRKELLNDNEITRSHIKECKEKEIASESRDKELAEPTPFSFVFYGNTPSKVLNPPVGAAAENVKVSIASADLPAEPSKSSPAKAGSLSDWLQNTIIHPQELALQLEAGHWNSYVPIDIRHLFKEAYAGTLTRDEFRELVIQDFFKSAAKLYRQTTPFAGSWKKAINHWYAVKFKAWTGDNFNKNVVFDDIQELRWRLEHARKFFSKVEFNPLYPSLYFDVSRTLRGEMGFEYTKVAWQRSQQYEKGEKERKRQRDKSAEKRKLQINYAKRCETEVRRFLKHKISFPQLLDYVEKNLPAEFKEKLPGIIEKINLTIK